MRLKTWISLSLLAISLLTLAKASNASDRLYNYPVEMLFNSTYRFLVLNKGFEVSKENPEIGLIMFTYTGGGVTDKSASVEIVANAAGPGTNRLRVQIPSVSRGTILMLADELNKKIQKDYAEAGKGEMIFHYPYEKLYSSIYRYLTVDTGFEVTDSQKEKGIIQFAGKKGETAGKKSFCEIFKRPDNSHKIRLTVASTSASSVRVYLNGITDKLKKDYEGAF